MPAALHVPTGLVQVCLLAGCFSRECTPLHSPSTGLPYLKPNMRGHIQHVTTWGYQQARCTRPWLPALRDRASRARPSLRLPTSMPAPAWPSPRLQGLKVAIVEGHDIGGTCVNRGCVPSKALLAASNEVRCQGNAGGFSLWVHAPADAV